MRGVLHNVNETINLALEKLKPPELLQLKRKTILRGRVKEGLVFCPYETL